MTAYRASERMPHNLAAVGTFAWLHHRFLGAFYG